jgi:putative PIN family toxin of toxin-antitoxin system
MLRVVLDTNVFVSSLLVKVGVSAQVLDAWRAGRYVLVTSDAIVAEMRSVLNYSRIRRKYPISDEEIERLVILIQQDALLVPGSAVVSDAISADPADEKILACALDGEADLIVSGDPHLLDLGKYQNIPVQTVRQFLTRLEAEEGDWVSSESHELP